MLKGSIRKNFLSLCFDCKRVYYKREKNMSVEKNKALVHGIVFKKAKEEPIEGEEKKIKFSTYLRGTHKSGSAKKKAEYKYKRALRNQKRGK